jgi:murein DD-endopeptidase MepM/ murein hydrolase activator NlpD
MKRLVLGGLIALLPFAAHAADGVTLKGEMTQGGLIIGTVPPGSTVALDETKISVGPDGGFAFGFGRDAKPEATLSVTYPDGRTETKTLAVKARKFNIQRINGLPEKMVTPPKDVLARIARDNRGVAAARSVNTPEEWYRTGFQWPAIGPISGVYGSQRILNGEPKQPHYGVDIAAPEGTPVKAPAEGIVRLADHDQYYTGGTVIIDHGQGISSSFLHMKDVKVKVGQHVKAGDVIGLLSHQGRVTGPHLDWRINWFQVRLDPQLAIGPMPTKP